jgi:hypothetical protein
MCRDYHRSGLLLLAGQRYIANKQLANKRRNPDHLKVASASADKKQGTTTALIF